MRSRKPVLTPAQRRTRTVRRALAARGFNETMTFFIPRAQAELFGGGDDARQLENPIASDLDALRPQRAAVAARGRRAQSGARLRQFDAVRDRRAIRQRHAGSPDDRRRRHPHRLPARAAGRRPRHPADAFDVKADMLARSKPPWARPMTAPVKAGAPAGIIPAARARWRSARKCSPNFGELHPKRPRGFRPQRPGRGVRGLPRRHPRTQSEGKARAVFAPSPFQAIERDFAFVVDAKVAAEDSAAPCASSASAMLIETRRRVRCL